MTSIDYCNLWNVEAGDCTFCPCHECVFDTFSELPFNKQDEFCLRLYPFTLPSRSNIALDDLYSDLEDNGSSDLGYDDDASSEASILSAGTGCSWSVDSDWRPNTQLGRYRRDNLPFTSIPIESIAIPCPYNLHPETMDDLLQQLQHSRFVISHEFALIKRGSFAANPTRARLLAARQMELLSYCIQQAGLDFDGPLPDMCACTSLSSVIHELQAFYEAMELCGLSTHKLWDFRPKLPPTPMFVLNPEL